MNSKWKRLLSLMLTLVMVLSLTVPSYAANDSKPTKGYGIEWGKVEDGTAVNLPRPEGKEFVEIQQDPNLPKGITRVSIVLSAAPTLDKYSTESIAQNKSAMQYRSRLQAQQNLMASRISKEALSGQKLDVVWNLTLAANIISANVPASKIEEIKALPGVADVVVEMRYEPQTAVSSDKPDQAVATDMTGTIKAWSSGYYGLGSKIAIVDTGLDTSHKSFDAAAFEYAVEKSDKDVELMDASDVSSVWSQLNASKFLTSDKGVYRDAKVPFGVNYVDQDLDITHENDRQGEHGSHVAGIAAANRYVSSGNGFEEALGSVYTQGQAPDAQLMIMKVFGKGGGAYDSDYFAAIEDAIVLGADSVNLSLGSSTAGLPTSATYAAQLEKMAKSDTVVAISAGNNYYWGDQTPFTYIYSDGANLHTGGSPGSFANAFTVASVNNDGVIGAPIKFNGESIFYTETEGYGNKNLTTIGGEHAFVYVDAPGTEEDFAAVKDILSGKIGMCNRGSTSFFEKANASVANGAIATIIVNNQPGSIAMNLSGYNYTAPAVSITLADGQKIKAGAEKHETEDGLVYYTGTLTIASSMEVETYDSEYKTMSDFSSWGTPGDLSFKPEITAPGGNIWSVFGTSLDSGGNPQGGSEKYEIMSGTSMAAPQIAGISAVLAEYLKENGIEADGMTRRALIQSLLMSTAEALVEEDSGSYYSVLKQGAGLVNLDAAMKARTYIKMDDTATPQSESAFDGKVKAELGDDPKGTGEYEVTFTVNNLSEEPMGIALDGAFFTQDMFDDYGPNLLVTWTTPINDCNITWIIDGEEYVAEDEIEYDFNGDGVFDHQDAQALLDNIVKGKEIINEDVAKSLDNEEGLSTRDAYICLTMANEATAVIEPEDSITVTAQIKLTIPEELDDNGNYVEGFLFVKEGDSADGAEGVEHSIPVLGYWGSWAEPSMFDVGSALEYEYELENRPPYMYTQLEDDALSLRSFIIKYPDGEFLFGGNPWIRDKEYMPERNAMNCDSTISKVLYTQIRNGAQTRLAVLDESGSALFTKDSGESYAAYYYRNGNPPEWRNTATQQSFGFKPAADLEGKALTLDVAIAPHYYLDGGEVDWDALADYEGLHYSVPVVIDNTEPVIDDMTVSNSESLSTGATERTLKAKVTENQYVAFVGLYNDKYELLDYLGSDPDAKAGASATYEFDLSELADEDHLLVLVADYANNRALYHINFNTEELEGGPSGITVEPNELVLIAGNSEKLSATVEPWGIDQSVTWSSSDESVATVDEKGTVTGVKAGVATITAAAAANPQLTDSAEVTVIEIDKKLNGVVWDENGEVWVSEFNLKSLPKYNALHEKSLRLPIASVAYDGNGTLYGASFDSENWVSSLYTMDPATFEVTEIGKSEIGYMDICAAPSLGDNHLLAVYGPNVVIVNKETGDYEGVFKLSSYTGGNNLVGIAYEEQYPHPSYGNTDWVFLLDSAGNIYSTGFLPYGGSYSRFDVTAIGAIGDEVDVPYFQSLYWDGSSLYWSRYNSEENDVDMILVKDLYKDGSIYNIGSFEDNVWPVGGLFELGTNPATGFRPAASDRHADAELDLDTEFLTDIEPIAVKSSAVKGGLNAVAPSNDTQTSSRTEKPREISANEAEVDIVIKSADLKQSSTKDVANNGLFKVKYDPAKLTYVGTETDLPYTSYEADEKAGVVTFAFADLDGVKANDAAATVKFEKKSASTPSVNVQTEEINDAEPENPTLPVIPVEPPAPVQPTEPTNPSEPGEPTNPGGSELPFVDVVKSDYFYDDVAYLYNAGFISGTSATTFSPDLPITRGMIVTIIWRVTGSPAAKAACPFADVAPGAYYETAIAWAAENGIVTGYDATTFGPEDSITREQLAAILYRYGQFRGVQPVTGSIDGFADANLVSAYAREPMGWAVGNRIMNGVGNNMLAPQGTATRAQAAAMINRFISNTGYRPNNTQKG